MCNYESQKKAWIWQPDSYHMIIKIEKNKNNPNKQMQIKDLIKKETKMTNQWTKRNMMKRIECVTTSELLIIGVLMSV